MKIIANFRSAPTNFHTEFPFIMATGRHKKLLASQKPDYNRQYALLSDGTLWAEFLPGSYVQIINLTS